MKGAIIFFLTLAVAVMGGCGNHAPVILPLQNQSVKTGETLEINVEAVDDDGDRLEFGIQGKPAAAEFSQIDAHRARFLWTPVASDAGPDGQGRQYPVTFLVGDGHATDSETIIIYVTLGGEGAGAPVFITPSDFTLDLSRSDTLNCHIEVRDNDSSQVTLRLVDNQPGGSFTTSFGSKMAEYTWKPSAEQIAERPVWSIRVGANDGQNPEVFQNITILIKGGQKKCQGTPPALQHQPLGDQRGSADYPVQVTVSDAESSVSAVALYWMVKTGSGDAFTKQSLTQAGGNLWQGSIPNPKLTGEQTAELLYYLCAVDNDDPAGSECDLRACLPESGRFSFTAYAAGSSSCQNDFLEGAGGNDSPASASAVAFDQNGSSFFEGLRICPGDVDWFKLQVPEGNTWAGALLRHAPANGRLLLDLYDATGTTLLASGELDGDDVIVVSDVLPQPTWLTLKVTGQTAQVENRYDMLVAWDRYKPCTADRFEDNNSPETATQVSSDIYSGLTCCGDPDWYRIQLAQGDRLEVELDFVNADGDLDLWIFDAYTAMNAETLSCDNALACSTTETDDERAVLEAAPAAGTYYIAVGPYQGARNGYDMMVLVTPYTPTCTDDNDEENDNPSQAKYIMNGVRSNRVVCPGDEDWYAVFMLQGEKLVVDTLFSHAGGDIDMKLYGPGTTPQNMDQHLLMSSLSSTDNEHVEYSITEEGDYFIRIYGYQLATPNTYALDVRFE